MMTVESNILKSIAKNGTYDPMDEWGFTAAAIALSLNGICGFLFNLFVIMLMCKDIQLWTPMNTILFNLVCSDLSVSVFGNPFTLTAAIYKGWIFGQTVCVAYGFFMSLLGMTSITTLTVLAYERFCSVNYPFSRRQLNRRSAIISIILIWIYALMLTLPPLFGWGAYVNEAANISCSVNWEEQTINATTYIIYLFTFGMIIPVLVILYCYIRIIQTMKKSAARLGKSKKSERKVTLMIAIMIAAFLLAWTPYAIFSLIKQFGNAEIIGPGMAILPSLIAKTSICYNPIIYVGMNSQFRKSFNRYRYGESSHYAATTMNTTMNRLSMDSNSIQLPIAKKKKSAYIKMQDLKKNVENDELIGSGKTVTVYEMTTVNTIGTKSMLSNNNLNQL